MHANSRMMCDDWPLGAAVRRLLLVGVVACSLLTGCQGADEAAVPAPTEIRHDLGPLTTRFPALGSPLSASWVTWNSATDGLAAPTTYWIDAVVTLEPATAALLTAYQPIEEGKRPTVQGVLESELPEGPFLTSAALDETLSSSGRRSAAYLTRTGSQLVISAFDD